MTNLERFVSRYSATLANSGSKGRGCALALASVMIWLGTVAGNDASAADTVPQVVHSFAGAGSGAQSNAVVQGTDGYLYGTTPYTNAGEDGWGVFYRVKPDGSGHQVLRAFDGLADGGSPRSALLVGKDGAIYGTNSTGLSNGAAWGTVWRYTSSGQFSVIVSFNMANGGYPAAALTQDSAGTLYGVASSGGAGGRGVVFRVQPDGSQFSLLHHFSGDAGGGIPRGISVASDGRLYGVAAIGGDTGEGVVFSLARDGTDFKRLHSFNSGVGEGNNPQSALVQWRDGSLYGTTNGGGSGGYGTVYKITPAGEFSTVLSFDDISNGAYPTAPLVVGRNGSLYGAAPYGGPSRQYGTLFQMSARGKVTGVVAMTESAYTPQVGLTTGSDGLMYTATAAGGSSGNGAVVMVDPAAFPSPVKTLPTATIYFNQLFPPLTTSNTQVGKKMQLHWVSEYANHCVASGAWTGRLGPEGNRYVSHDQPGQYLYTLTCTNANGSTTTNSTLYVSP